MFIAYLNSISQRVVSSFGKFTSELTSSIINELVGQFDLLWWTCRFDNCELVA